MNPNRRPAVLITGASRGLGRAIATALADTWHIHVGGTNAVQVDDVVRELPSAEPFVVDLTDERATADLARRITRLDALVHSAGIAMTDRIDEATREQWRHQFEVNVFAVADLTRLLLPLLRASHGQIVMINSGAGLRSGKRVGLYAGSKFALLALTDALREEERGVIRVTSIHPGRVDTDMQREIQALDGRPYDPQEHLRPESVAATVRLALTASPEALIESLTIRPVRR